MVEDISKDRAGGNLTTQHYCIEYLNNNKSNKNMIDIWWKQNPKKTEYTYFNDLGDFKCRIDRFCLTSDIETNYKIRTQIIQNYLSDRQMITLNIHKKMKRKEVHHIRNSIPVSWKTKNTKIRYLLFGKNG